MQNTLETLAGRRCVVTGAGGFIGTALCQRLHEAGAEVHALGRRAAPQADGPWSSWRVCDVGALPEVQAALRDVRPHTIFHMASKVSGSQDLAQVLPMLHANLLGFVHVALTAGELGCRRLITAGSLMEPDQHLPAVPPSPYAAAKFAASCHARMFSSLHGLPVVIARLMMVYGPGQLDFTKVVPHVISRLVKGEPTELSSGRQRFDWVFIDDVTDALLRMAVTPGLSGTTLDVGTGVLTPVADMATGIARRLEAGPLLRLGALPDRRLEPTRGADVDATQERLSWRARVDVEAGLDVTAAWYARHLAAVSGR
jgi:nucleoside-diphosphate-sugar epimerase